jgi:PAS domain S-box-containing protein
VAGFPSHLGGTTNTAVNKEGGDSFGPIRARMRNIERREVWLWGSAFAVTILLTLAIVVLALPVLRSDLGEQEIQQMNLAIRGLVGMVLLFDVFAVYQQVQIYRMRRRLLEREELFRLISENAADMIAVVGVDGQRVYNSPSYQKILGYSLEELQRTSALEQVHPEDRQKIIDAGEEAKREGVGRRIEYRMRHKDGSWRVLESTASAVRDSAGKVQNLIIVNRDITDRRSLEEQFRQAQKMEAIGRLSGGVAHDFNNLLGVIIGYAEILTESTNNAEIVQGSADEILKAGKRAASLTRQLLAFSRQQVLELKVLDLNAVVVDMEKMLLRLIGEDVELTTLLDPKLGRIKADAGQLEQVVMNLAVNARDAMPEGGKLIIQTVNFQMDEHFVRRYPYPVKPGAYARLTVQDTGTGMDAPTQARIFEPFFTTKEKGKGTGLGLSTVYGVVKQSGGYIEVQSEIGKGTTFIIYMPTVEAAIETDATVHENAAGKGVETILLVEDEAALRTLSRNLLQLGGYTVIEAQNGNEALEIVEKHQGTIHLLLTDVVMPGISGRELAKKLTLQRPDLKVVYMSGYTGQAVGDNEVLGKRSFFLQKPFSRQSLTQKVREALDSTAAAERT